MENTIEFIKTMTFLMWHGMMDFTCTLRHIGNEEIKYRRAVGPMWTSADAWSKIYEVFGKVAGYQYSDYISLGRYNPLVWNVLARAFDQYWAVPVAKASFERVIAIVKIIHDEHVLIDSMKAFALRTSDKMKINSLNQK